MNDPVFLALAQAAGRGEPVALGLIASVKGSSPQKVGAKALFFPDGRIVGTLGGGCLEAEVQRRAIQALRTGQATAFDLVLDHDYGWDDGLICGGSVGGLLLPQPLRPGEKFWRELAERKTPISWGVAEDYTIVASPALPSDSAVHAEPAAKSAGSKEWLYRETVTPPCALWIAGAGHIAQAVAPLALQLDFEVTVFDDRPAFANHHFFPREVALQAAVWEEMLALPLPVVPSFGLIVTRGHRHDAQVLQAWIRRPFAFLGMIGSARKARTMREHFLEAGTATRDELDRVACPVGIPIESQTVPEIAISILAQLIEKRARLPGRPAKGRQPASEETT